VERSENMKRKIAKSIILALVIFTLSFSVLTAVIMAQGDYSYPGATARTEIFADEFLEEYVGVADLSEAEAEYLRRHSGFVLAYNSHIPTAYVDTEYDDTASSLTVWAREYKYTAKNGTEVIWIPVSVTVGGDTLPLTSPDYKATLTASSQGKASVKYRAELTVSEESVNRLLNLAYCDAPRLDSEIENHRADTERYNEYLADLAVYNEYLAKKKIYDAERAEYEKYLLEYAEYEADLVRYAEYEKAKEEYYKNYAVYLEYKAYAEKHQSEIDAYKSYVEGISAVQHQLGIIEATKTSITPLKRSVYSAIMGDTVTSVIENKDAIANAIVGADGKVIDRAGAATENLRALFRGYFACTDENGKYNYYITNYEAFRDNFAELLRALDRLYMYPRVRGILIAEDKAEKYVILVAQLYYIATALSDTPVLNYDQTAHFDSSYIIGKGYSDAKSPSDAIYNEEYVTDTDSATPLKSGYPTPVAKPEYTEMQEPVMPKPVSVPIPPTAVPQPSGEPVPVTQPTPVSKPGRAPVITPETEAIITAYKRGELFLRAERTGDVALTPEIEVERGITDTEEVTVRYYDGTPDNIGNLLYEISVERGTYADYLGALPEKPETSEYYYEFSRWTDSCGESPDLTSISEDLMLYPEFSAVEKEYTSSWIIDGETYYEEPTEPRKKAVGNICYVFSGWEESVDFAELHITYTALFDERYLLPLDNGRGAEITVSGTDYTANVGAHTEIYVGNLLDNLANDGSFRLVGSSIGEISFSYSDTVKLYESGVKYIKISASGRTDNYSYVYTLLDLNKSPINSSSKATVTFRCDMRDSERVYLFSNASRDLVRNTYQDGELSFVAQSGITYNARVEYTLKAISTAHVQVSLSKSVAEFGERIDVILTAADGIRIDSVYFVGTDGVKTEITDGSFSMPRDDISIIVDYKVLEYTVVFESEGKTIVTYKCLYGETVTPPGAPSKASDGKYTYTFFGWSSPIVPVTEDAVYSAIFTHTPIETEEKDGLQISEGVLKKLVTVGVIAAVFVVILIGTAVTVTIVVIRRKRTKSGKTKPKRKRQ
jgi:hypothetical protein